MVWYAAYGSNIHRDRFMEYITGGTSKYNGQQHPGCRDRSDPIRDRATTLDRQLYFAKSSTSWAGGVAFVRPEPGSGAAVGRAYLITEQQFLDIATQELGRRPGDPGLAFDYAYAEKNPECYLNPADPSKPVSPGRQLWYARVLRLGTHESWPVLTLTGEWEGIAGGNAPSRQYLVTIATGLREISKLPRAAIIDYFSRCVGVKDRLSRTLLERWL